MLVETILFGKIEIPNCKEDIEKDIAIRKMQYNQYPYRYTQAVIDCLESELDERRKDNVWI